MSLLHEKLKCSAANIELLTAYAGDLAPYIIKGQAVLHQPPPRVATGIGAANVLLAFDTDFLFADSQLSPAFVLPLRWILGKPDSSRLPQGGPEIACRVRAVLNIQGWGLSLDSLIREDLSGLLFGWESAFVSLAAALIVAVNGGESKGDIFATGAWDGQSIGAVSHVDEKAKAVAAICPDATLFLPPQHVGDVPSEILGHIFYYPTPRKDIGDIQKLLQEHLALLDVPPTLHEPLEKRCNYANRPYLTISQNRSKYYREHLLQGLAHRLCQTLPQNETEVYQLVTALSFRWESTALLVLALKPKRLTVFYSENSQRYVSEIKKYFESSKITCEVIAELWPDAITECLENIEKNIIYGPYSIVDVTAGTSEMSVFLSAAALKQKNRITYLRHEQNPQGAVIYGRETLVFIQDHLS